MRKTNLLLLLCAYGCHPECKGGCRVANSSVDCVECKHYGQQLRNRGGTKCVNKCESGYYLDAKEKRCNLCLGECATCSSPNYCDTCVPPLYLIISDPEDLSHGKCETECPEGFVPDLKDIDHPKCRIKCDDGCLKCSDQGPCLFCRNGYFLTSKGTCVQICPVGYFANSASRKCQRCPEDCLRCRSSSACDVCKPGTMWDALTSRCALGGLVKSCNKNDECPRGTFCDKVIHACEPCHPDCADCVGPNFDQCIMCNDGQKPDPKTNKCACQPGFYFNSELVRCEKCHEACATCHGPTSHMCSSCLEGYKLLGSSCVKCCNATETFSNDYCAMCTDDPSSRSYAPVRYVLIFVLIVVVLLIVKLFWKDSKKAKKPASNYNYSKIPIGYNTESDNLILSAQDAFSSDEDIDVEHHEVLAKIMNNRS